MRDDGGPRAVWFLTGAALGAAIALLYAMLNARHVLKAAKEDRG